MLSKDKSEFGDTATPGDDDESAKFVVFVLAATAEGSAVANFPLTIGGSEAFIFFLCDQNDDKNENEKLRISSPLSFLHR